MYPRRAGVSSSEARRAAIPPWGRLLELAGELVEHALGPRPADELDAQRDAGAVGPGRHRDGRLPGQVNTAVNGVKRPAVLTAVAAERP